MWDLLAPIIRWPLYSPARFVTVVVVTLVVVFVLGEVNDRPEQAGAKAGPPTSTSAEDPPSTPVDAGSYTHATDELSVDPAEHDPSAAAADAAAAFVAAWARPDLGPEAWAAGVRPLVTPELWAGGLNVTDPSRTPQVSVRGEPHQVALNAEEGVFDVPTTGAWVRVHIVVDSATDGWLISSVEPVG